LKLVTPLLFDAKAFANTVQCDLILGWYVLCFFYDSTLSDVQSRLIEKDFEGRLTPNKIILPKVEHASSSRLVVHLQVFLLGS